ncbi:MAG: hypothetical protein P4M14_02030 [Gammaproteobacteria bacterium]|nr:hypothetical protein [Gammaproteobacteria bacterium]
MLISILRKALSNYDNSGYRLLKFFSFISQLFEAQKLKDFRSFLNPYVNFPDRELTPEEQFQFIVLLSSDAEELPNSLKEELVVALDRFLGYEGDNHGYSDSPWEFICSLRNAQLLSLSNLAVSQYLIANRGFVRAIRHFGENLNQDIFQLLLKHPPEAFLSGGYLCFTEARYIRLTKFNLILLSLNPAYSAQIASQFIPLLNAAFEIDKVEDIETAKDICRNAAIIMDARVLVPLKDLLSRRFLPARMITSLLAYCDLNNVEESVVALARHMAILSKLLPLLNLPPEYNIDLLLRTAVIFEDPIIMNTLTINARESRITSDILDSLLVAYDANQGEESLKKIREILGRHFPTLNPFFSPFIQHIALQEKDGLSPKAVFKHLCRLYMKDASRGFSSFWQTENFELMPVAKYYADKDSASLKNEKNFFAKINNEVSPERLEKDPVFTDILKSFLNSYPQMISQFHPLLVSSLALTPYQPLGQSEINAVAASLIHQLPRSMDEFTLFFAANPDLAGSLRERALQRTLALVYCHDRMEDGVIEFAVFLAESLSEEQGWICAEKLIRESVGTWGWDNLNVLKSAAPKLLQSEEYKLKAQDALLQRMLVSQDLDSGAVERVADILLDLGLPLTAENQSKALQLIPKLGQSQFENILDRGIISTLVPLLPLLSNANRTSLFQAILETLDRWKNHSHGDVISSQVVDGFLKIADRLSSKEIHRFKKIFEGIRRPILFAAAFVETPKFLTLTDPEKIAFVALLRTDLAKKHQETLYTFPTIFRGLHPHALSFFSELELKKARKLCLAYKSKDLAWHHKLYVSAALENINKILNMGNELDISSGACSSSGSPAASTTAASSTESKEESEMASSASASSSFSLTEAQSSHEEEGQEEAHPDLEAIKARIISYRYQYHINYNFVTRALPYFDENQKIEIAKLLFPYCFDGHYPSVSKVSDKMGAMIAIMNSLSPEKRALMEAPLLKALINDLGHCWNNNPHLKHYIKNVTLPSPEDFINLFMPLILEKFHVDRALDISSLLNILMERLSRAARHQVVFGHLIPHLIHFANMINDPQYNYQGRQQLKAATQYFSVIIGLVCAEDLVSARRGVLLQEHLPLTAVLLPIVNDYSGNRPG